MLPAMLSTPESSPFLLNKHDIRLLDESEGFRILRSYLSQHCCYDLCEKHAPAYHKNIDQWILVRDVLHALLVPVVELFDKASTVAAQVTCANKLEDLEYAFHGQARSAFLWLQCFLATETERDWCYTKGCPPCLVDHALDSEFTVRLLYGACLLSDVHYPFTLDGPTLPSFMFFLDSLEAALEEDSLYGPDFFERTKPKAMSTRNGVEDLIHQCIELEATLSPPSSPESCSPSTSRPTSPGVDSLSGPGMKIKRSRMARRQMRLEMEETQHIEELLRNCWNQLQPAVEEDLMPVPIQSLNNAMAQPSMFGGEKHRIPDG